MIIGGKQDANASFVLRVKSIEKKPATSRCTPKTREEHEKVRAILTAAGLGDWPVVMLVFTSEGLSILQIPYVIDPQAMQEALERQPSVVHSGLLGSVSIPMTEENIRENLNNFILVDKSNRFLLRTNADPGS